MHSHQWLWDACWSYITNRRLDKMRVDAFKGNLEVVQTEMPLVLLPAKEPKPETTKTKVKVKVATT